MERVSQVIEHRYLRAFLALAALSVANALVLGYASLETGAILARVQLFAVLGHALLGSLLVLWVLKDIRFECVPICAAVALAMMVRLISVWASPLLEDDHYRYLWDGFRTAVAFNPYAFAPRDFFADRALADHWQEILSGINHPELATIYGPVLQFFFALAYFIQPGKLGAIQGLLLVTDLAVIALLIFERVPSRWILVYAIHPAITKEVMASAHPDILVALFLLIACLAWSRQRQLITGAMLGLAVATKVPAILGCILLVWRSKKPLASKPLVPNLDNDSKDQSGYWRTMRPDWSWTLPGFLAMATVLTLAYLPFWLLSGSDLASLVIFGERWKFNPLLFRLIELVLGADLARPVALMVFLMASLGLVWRWRIVNQSYPPIEVLFTVLLILSPVVNPWYWAWGLALAVLKRSEFYVLLACGASLSYLNHTVLSEAGVLATRDLASSFGVPWAVTISQLSLLLVLVLWMQMRRAATKRSLK